MAKLSRFRQNSAAVNGGEWVDLGDEFDGLEIRTRGLTDAYWDMQNKRRRVEARRFDNDVNLLPNATQREINAECLIAHVVLDVRNLTGDDGKPVPVEEFYGLLRHPDYNELIVACFRAAARVANMRLADIEEASGPLPTRSATISNGGDSPG